MLVVDPADWASTPVATESAPSTVRTTQEFIVEAWDFSHTPRARIRQNMHFNTCKGKATIPTHPGSYIDARCRSSGLSAHARSNGECSKYRENNIETHRRTDLGFVRIEIVTLSNVACVRPRAINRRHTNVECVTGGTASQKAGIKTHPRINNWLLCSHPNWADLVGGGERLALQSAKR